MLANKLSTRSTSFNIKFAIFPLSLCRPTGFEIYKTGEVRKMFQSRLVSKRAKLKLYYSVIRPIVTYSCETWIIKETIINP